MLNDYYFCIFKSQSNHLITIYFINQICLDMFTLLEQSHGLEKIWLRLFNGVYKPWIPRQVLRDPLNRVGSGLPNQFSSVTLMINLVELLMVLWVNGITQILYMELILSYLIKCGASFLWKRTETFWPQFQPHLIQMEF
jgi:hypothetical protein